MTAARKARAPRVKPQAAPLPRRPLGRPISTGGATAKMVRFRVTAAQRAELDAEGARLGISGDLLAKRRLYPPEPTVPRAAGRSAP